MKRATVVVVALAASLATIVPTAAEGEEMVTWLADYGQALAEARRTGKPIFLEYRCAP